MPSKAISFRCENYPACFIDDSAGDNIPCCLLCGYRAEDGRDLVNHIREEHPIKDVECFKCRVHTRVEGSNYCSYCLEEAEVEAERVLETEEEKKPDKLMEVVEVKKENKCQYCGKSCRGKTCSSSECQRRYSEDWYAKNRKTGKPVKVMKSKQSVVPKKLFIKTLKNPAVTERIDDDLFTMQQILGMYGTLSQAGRDYVRMRLFDG